MTVRLLVELRRGPSNVIPWRLGSDENVRLDLDAGIAVDASQRHPMNLSFVGAAERGSADAAKAKAPARDRLVANEPLLSARPSKGARLDLGVR